MLKKTSTCRFRTVLVLIVCLVLPVCAATAQVSMGKLHSTTENRPALDPDGAV